ncbi:hypothetical protein Mp_6g13220 [Marchantia polymorpha subsp. ruderalis]|uniref:Uncharacterized protein n=2 Tax=Marchantia polymorpha TaxID=3197 RepID=A0AAF6BRL0_MARPO|nr:hypothetical protein MARPO_0059s0027 [Marchantia polymorpha]BBN14644.1 hypothetical protein Mp_6g13220 [Marchantia polymorpha subsp. ruderalis]|eukprot:PTQ37075.1 hypothetical protein MARPO_0059s0027 [Marchantia polymorpha]
MMDKKRQESQWICYPGGRRLRTDSCRRRCRAMSIRQSPQAQELLSAKEGENLPTVPETWMSDFKANSCSCCCCCSSLLSNSDAASPSFASPLSGGGGGGDDGAGGSGWWVDPSIEQSMD